MSCEVLSSAFDAAGGRRATTELLTRPGPAATALFVVNDFAAIGALGAIRDQGLSVGKQMAVVGYNDIDIAAELPVPLTSVASPMHRMGARAVELLLAVLAGETVTSERLMPTLQIRESATGTGERD